MKWNEKENVKLECKEKERELCCIWVIRCYGNEGNANAH